MARSDTRYSVYPSPKSVEVVGNSAPALNQAIECWAALLVRAMADNSKIIFPVDPAGTGPLFTPGQPHFLHEWCVLAEALQGKRFDPDFANPGDLLATAVEDAHRFESVGDKWFKSEFDGEMHATGLKRCFVELVEKLHRLDYPHAWAAIVAVRWFWEHQDEGIDIWKDPWWTPAFRRQWKERQASKQGPGGAEEQPRTEARKGKRRGAPKKGAETEGE